MRERFTTLETSSYRSIVIGVIVVTCVELPILHMLVSSMLWHAIIALLHLSTLVWLIRDYRSMRATGHHLDDETLHLHLGNRWRAHIPRAHIATATLGAPDRDLFEDTPRGVLKITPFDPPNTTLTLTQPVDIIGPFNKRFPATTLELYVDAPERLITALNTPP